MKETLTIVMLVLLIAPMLVGVRRLRRTLGRAAESKEDGKAGREDRGSA